MRITILLLFMFPGFSSIAQKINASYQLHIHKASGPIEVDGRMEEKAWNDAEPASDFFMVTPMDTSFSKVRTEVRMSHDDDNLYIIATCYLFKPGPYMVESLRRDFAFGKNDNFIFFIDPFDDQTNGFTFGANASGAQWDGTLYEGGKADLSWDNKWVSVVTNYPDKWVFEASIPFKSIRYKKGIKSWGINFS
ncbi:MAG TPA: carbohydrate binding family 9 domain-containing protein, partial [Chitinophagaceae bacterium]|nr:carbohydrate binding family 9 domain-containing protein [Chitinophagaceae bacterium]